MNLETIQLESRNGVATVTLNRPQFDNTINVTMVRELEQVCHALEDTSDDRAVVFQGAGEMFCAGIDLRDFAPHQKPDVRGFSRWERTCRAIERLPKLTLAGVDGECAGGGLQLALVCDIRLATERSFFHLHEIRDGFLPGMGTFRLAKFIGLGRARHLAITGRKVDAEEAYRIGLVDQLCESHALEDAAAETLLSCGEIHADVVGLTRRLFDESFEMAYEEFIGGFLAAQHRAIQSEAFKRQIRSAHDRNTPR